MQYAVFFVKNGRWTLHDIGTQGYCETEARALREMGLTAQVFQKRANVRSLSISCDIADYERGNSLVRPSR